MVMGCPPFSNYKPGGGGKESSRMRLGELDTEKKGRFKSKAGTEGFFY